MLFDQINKDYITAMKAKDAFKVSTLSFLRAQLKNVIIDTRVETLDDAGVIAIIKKQVKQRQDSIEQFEKGGRPELAEKEKQEMAVLKSYLPEEMGEEALLKFVQDAVAESGAKGAQDMGKVMKALMPKVAGKADNRMVSDLVKKVLAGM